VDVVCIDDLIVRRKSEAPISTALDLVSFAPPILSTLL